jgi:cytochrome c oxidase subunit 4
MDAHGSASVEHTHPSSMTYVKIGVVLFVLTALEVGLYEFTYGEHSGATGHALQPFFVPLLLALSAAKFALVAMFYMHLKQDHRLFSGVFVFPLIIATVIILALIVLEAYHFAFAKAGAG